MTEKIQNTIKEEVLKLTKDTQDAINGLDWVKITTEIGEKYNLTESEVGDLIIETLLVLSGFEEVESYAKKVEDEVGTTQEDANKIAEEVIQGVFFPISNVILDKIKKSDRVKNSNFKQNINFILSGGNYSSFLEEKRETNSEQPKQVETLQQERPIDIYKESIEEDSKNTQQTNRISKMDDMKNKLVI